MADLSPEKQQQGGGGAIPFHSGVRTNGDDSQGFEQVLLSSPVPRQDTPQPRPHRVASTGEANLPHG